MLMKKADDQSKRLALLESLQDAPALDAAQRRWLGEELWRLRQGLRGESSAAHYIDNHYKDSPHSAVIHDLRLEVDGEVAQIDHLIISRGFMFYLLETKNFSGDLAINEHGEFTVSYSGRQYGIPSPLEQSVRHEKVLARCLERLGIVGRVSEKPQFFHVVLVDPRRVIRRPDAAKFDTRCVIKADQFASWRNEHVDRRLSLGSTLTAIMNIRSSDTVREWAEMLVRQHRPADALALPDFMRPKAAVSCKSAAAAPAPAPGVTERCAQCQAPLSADVVGYCRRHAHRFAGALYCRDHQSALAQGVEAVQPPAVAPPAAPQRSLVCASCGARIQRAEGLFCWRNAKRFGGLQYCRTHQADF